MAKPLVLADMRERAGQFVAAWRDAEGYERGEAQEFVRELLAIFGISGRTAASYEYRAQRASTGGHGFIDALISGTAIIEMKSAGRDLAKAEQQALDYMDDLKHAEKPDFIITSDFKRFRILDLTATAAEDPRIEFPLEDLPQHVEDLMFLAGFRRQRLGKKQEAEASIHAAQLMAKLWEHLEKTGYDDHQASIFLIRTLFCLYADDSGVWERDLFSRYLRERTSEDGSDLGSQLCALYQALNKPEDKRFGQDDSLMQSFPYVNGAVFGEATEIPYFNRAARDFMLEASAFNWSKISPAIFGSLFQAVKDKKARRELGEHYTTETNILKLIRPLFLDELEAAFSKVHNKKGDLEKLRQRLGDLHFFDPACGCGNFLIIAYRELRALELRILQRIQEIDKEASGGAHGVQLALDATSLVSVKLSHFHGLEIEEWPATIARTAMFLVEHQANQAINLTLGNTVPLLPLSDVADIRVANALRTDWSTVVQPGPNVYVMGNPPFLGDHTRGAEQLEDLRNAWGGDKQLSRMDYVTGWHAKTLEYFRGAHGATGDWAFVTTNSITQGDQVERLFAPIYSDLWRIKFAHRTFAWTSEAPGAAAVHCVIVGFTQNKRTKQRLFTYASVKAEPVEVPVAASINAYLLDASNVMVAKRSTPLSSDVRPVEYGSKPTDDGNLVVEPEDYAEVAADPIASQYLHPYVGARELMHGEKRWCLWLEDMDPDAPRRSNILRERIDAVREFRAKSKAASTREYPYHHLFRQLAKQSQPYVCIPSVVSENRRYFTVMQMDPEVITSNLAFQCTDPDGLQFALLSSSMFIAWQKAVGGRLKSDLRFASTLTWYTFPLPELAGKDRQAIIEAGHGVLEARALHPDRTLAQHYNPRAMSPKLVAAHNALDRAVDRAFGARKTLSGEVERQELLFKRYAELTSIAGR